MNLDDRARLFEEAFAKIEPKDDAQREKLETMRDRIRRGNAETARELADLQDRIEAIKNPPHQEEILRLAGEKSRLAEEASEAMGRAWEEHTGFLRRIAAETRRAD